MQHCSAALVSAGFGGAYAHHDAWTGSPGHRPSPEASARRCRLAGGRASPIRRWKASFNGNNLRKAGGSGLIVVHRVKLAHDSPGLRGNDVRTRVVEIGDIPSPVLTDRRHHRLFGKFWRATHASSTDRFSLGGVRSSRLAAFDPHARASHRNLRGMPTLGICV